MAWEEVANSVLRMYMIYNNKEIKCVYICKLIGGIQANTHKNG